MFRITDRKGFQVTFENGWTVSVQFGYGNYCMNKYAAEYGQDAPPCEDAEIAAWSSDGVWHQFDCGDYKDDVSGGVKPNEVLEFMNMIAAK